MARDRPTLAPVILAAVLATNLWAALLVVLFDPVPVMVDAVNTLRIRWQLPRAEARWQSSELSSYRLHVTGGVPMVCIIDAELTVNHGQLTDVAIRTNPFLTESPLVPLDRQDWDRPGCSYDDLVVERMFDRVEGDLAAAGAFPIPIAVEFDEARGFISEYRLGRESRGGVFGYTVSECCTGFRFDGFTPIAE